MINATAFADIIATSAKLFAKALQGLAAPFRRCAPPLLHPLRQHQALGRGEALFGEEIEEPEIVPSDPGAHGLDVKGGAAGRIARPTVLT